MPKKLKDYYTKVPNMGDILNRDFIEGCFGCEFERHSYLAVQVSGGCGLENCTFEERAWKNALKAVSGILCFEVFIWGVGFVELVQQIEGMALPNGHFGLDRFVKHVVEAAQMNLALLRSNTETILDPTGEPICTDVAKGGRQ